MKYGTIIVVIFGFFMVMNCNQQIVKTVIVTPRKATSQETLAAKEVRRYVYQRTGELLPIARTDSLNRTEKNVILVARKDRLLVKNLQNEKLKTKISNLGDQEYVLQTVAKNRFEIVVLCGGDETGTLYAAYRFAEHLGMRFYLHGDVIPDEKIKFQLPHLDETGKPLFSTRGIQPFHDFPEGPDWWTTDDYKSVLSQLPKLRMNFLGLHTYPEGNVGPEPTVWIGLKKDIENNGKVKFSYPARHFTTVNGTWGYEAKKTGNYYYGAGQLFERDEYSTSYMKDMAPWPENPAEKNELFNRTGNFFRDVFSYAKLYGIKTCVGTETPLIIPKEVRERIKIKGTDPQSESSVQELYEGMFDWIKQNYPVDYYWFWTPENWTWGGNTQTQLDQTKRDLFAAIQAARNVRAPFTLATCGWVLGPKQDRSMFDRFLPKEMPMSCINRQVGFAPVETGFARVKNRPKWAIPWLEDDPALIIPQLWAGRMRKDAADALAYGCTGLIGIHWRTRILGPNVSALARAAWEQKSWNPEFGKKFVPSDNAETEGASEAKFANFPGVSIENTDEDSLYQTMIYAMTNYDLKIPDGNYKLTLKFCELYYKEKGKRVFDITIQKTPVVKNFDIFARVGNGKALDLTFENIRVSDGKLKILFDDVADYPSLAGIVITGVDRNGKLKTYRKINCGGKKYKNYEADPSLILQGNNKNRDLAVNDFYSDWAMSQFGGEVSAPMADLFTRLDGSSKINDNHSRKANLPRPANWNKGPGGIFPDSGSWQEVRKQYDFVREMEILRPKVKGKGNLERFDYWLNNFRYLRAIGKFNCTLYEYDRTMAKVKAEKDSETRRKQAREQVLPIRKKLITELTEIQKNLLKSVSTTGGLGTVTNWQQHNIPMHIDKPGQELADILGEKLPEDAVPPKEFPGEARIIVPTVRTSLAPGEPLRLKVILLDARPKAANLFRKKFGQGNFIKTGLKHVNRGVYSVTVPADSLKDDFEYYIEIVTEKNRKLVFPATAPDLNQTVVVF